MRLLIAIALALLIVLAATPVAAHEDIGEMTVTQAEQVGSGLVRVEIGLLYADDGHFAEDATVTATFSAADGATAGPVPLGWLRDALYAAEVDLPAGTWTVEVSSVDPTATATAQVEVSDTTATTTSTAAPATSTTATTTSTTAPTGPDDGTGADDGTSDYPWVAIVAGGAALALVAAGIWLLITRDRTESEPEATDSDEDGEC